MTTKEVVELRTDEAKPCPFCGAQPIIEPWCDGQLVSCCGDACPVYPSATGPDRQTALDRWNTREGGQH